MDSFAPRDIAQYYRGSFIRHPTNGKPYQIREINPESGALLLQDMAGGHVDQISHTAVKFEHVKIPKLGYRCLDGKYLYYLTKIVGNNRIKGVNRSNISIESSRILASILRLISEHEHVLYAMSGVLQLGPLAEQIFIPVFTSFSTAVDSLLNRGGIAHAINYDFALSLGKRADRALTLQFKGFQDVAYSEDGNTWRLVHDEFRNVIERSIGVLKYEA